MARPIPKGHFVWYELLTTNPAAGIGFYEKVIGWGRTEAEVPGGVYRMLTRDDRPLAGAMELPAEAVEGGAVPHWLAYISTPDVAATVAQAESLGAKVLVAPQNVPGAGTFAVFADPQGALFAVLAPEQPVEDAAFSPDLKQFSWHELATSDHEAAFSFYSQLFGWEKGESNDMGEMGIYQMYGLKGAPMGGMFNKPQEMPGPPAWCVYVRVDDLEAALEEAKKCGGQVVNGPMEVPGGDRIAQLMDPQGAVFALHTAAS